MLSAFLARSTGITPAQRRQLTGTCQINLSRCHFRLPLQPQVGIQNVSGNGESSNRKPDDGERPGPSTSTTGITSIFKTWKCRRSRFTCLFCGSLFQFWCHLASHMRTHTKERPYKCVTCGASFAQPKTLRDHRLCRHSTSEKKFMCQFCPKRFHLLGGLFDHLRRHIHEKSESCSVCGKEFAMWRALQMHQLIHSGKKMHKCKICLRRFLRQADLECHIRRHTGETPYKCSSCPLAFRSLSARNYHLKKSGHVKM